MSKLQFPSTVRSPKKPNVVRSCSGHRAWVRKHHCSVRGCTRIPIECAHIRTGTDGGLGLKPSDRWCISLCAWHHAEQHRIGEQRFGDKYDLDLLTLASEFARRTPYRDRFNFRV
jgi:hypothetical protein